MFKRWSCIIVGVGLLGGLLVGCSSHGEQTTKPDVTENQDPVTVTIGYTASQIVDEELQDHFINPAHKKYPYITVEIVPIGGSVTLANLLAANQLPDIIHTNTNAVSSTNIAGFQQDITEVIKRNKFDLSRFLDEPLDTLKTNNGTAYLPGFPVNSQINALYYNKDIFDKFGVPYPKDGLTWEAATELAKKLTRMDGGVQYRGLEPDTPGRAGQQLGLVLVDPKTNKSIADSDGWKRIFQMWKDIYSIPGNGRQVLGSAAETAFAKDQNIAMYAGLSSFARLGEVKDWNNWDIAEYPSFADHPDVGVQRVSRLMLMSATTKHPDATFKVLSSIVSDEVQMDMASRYGLLSVLKGKQYEENFGKELAVMKGKHIESIFKSKPAKALPASIYNSYSYNQVKNVVPQLVNGQVDVNTATRQYNELVDKYVQEQLSQ